MKSTNAFHLVILFIDVFFVAVLLAMMLRDMNTHGLCRRALQLQTSLRRLTCLCQLQVDNQRSVSLAHRRSKTVSRNYNCFDRDEMFIISRVGDIKEVIDLPNTGRLL